MLCAASDLCMDFFFTIFVRDIREIRLVRHRHANTDLVSAKGSKKNGNDSKKRLCMPEKSIHAVNLRGLFVHLSIFLSIFVHVGELKFVFFVAGCRRPSGMLALLQEQACRACTVEVRWPMQVFAKLGFQHVKNFRLLVSFLHSFIVVVAKSG